MNRPSASKSLPVSPTLVDRLRAESKAADDQMQDIPSVIAGGIRYLAALCAEAADAIESSQRSETTPRIEKLPPVVTPEPNHYKVPPRYPVRIGACVFWNDAGHLRASPVGEPTITLGEPLNVLFRELGVSAERDCQQK